MQLYGEVEYFQNKTKQKTNHVGELSTFKNIVSKEDMVKFIQFVTIQIHIFPTLANEVQNLTAKFTFSES